MKLLTVREAAERMNVSASTIYELCSKKKLPHARIGLGRGVIRIAEGDLESLWRNGRVEAPAIDALGPELALKHITLK